MRFYSKSFEGLINCGIDPVGESIVVSEHDLDLMDNKPVLRLNFGIGLQPLVQLDSPEDSSNKKADDSDYTESDQSSNQDEAEAEDESVIPKTRPGKAGN